MRIAFAVLIGIHGLIHTLGAVRGLGWADVQQLRTPTSPIGAAPWAAVSILLVGAAIGFGIGARWWWWLGLLGAVISQILIAHAWRDAKFGTIANALLASPLLLAIVDARPSSFRSRFDRDRQLLLSRHAEPAALVTEADIARLPTMMQVYLRRRRPPSRAEHARALQRTDAQQRDIAVDERHRRAI